MVDADDIRVTFEHVGVGAGLAVPDLLLGPCSSHQTGAEVGSVMLPMHGRVGQTVIVTMSAQAAAFNTPDYSVPDGVLEHSRWWQLVGGIRGRLSFYTVVLTADHLLNGLEISWDATSMHGSGYLTIHALPVPGAWAEFARAGMVEANTSVNLSGATLLFAWATGASTSSASKPGVSPDRPEICGAGGGSFTEHWWYLASGGEDTVIRNGNSYVDGYHVRLS